MWTHLSRLGGGIGTRGPEKHNPRLTEDRSVVEFKLKQDLNKVKLTRENQRKKNNNTVSNRCNYGLH